MAKVLITGGAGYVGSHCVKKVIDAGHDCVVLDNLSRGNKNHVKWCPLEVGDIRDKRKLKEIFSGGKFDAVMHFAAYAYVGESVNEPLLYWDNNFVGTKCLLESMLESNIDKIVFSSTCAVYGQPTVIPISESADTNPINPYGHSKLACENLMDQLGVANGLKSIRFRYFNAAGSDYRSGIGETHNPETHLIPLVIDSALDVSNRLTINIYGNDYGTPDGTAIRDYIHVKDLANAHLLGLEHLLNDGKSDYFNLGTGRGSSVNQVIENVERHTDRRVKRSIKPRRPGDPAELVADAAKVKNALGWKAELGLDNIIFDALEWKRLSQND